MTNKIFPIIFILFVFLIPYKYSFSQNNGQKVANTIGTGLNILQGLNQIYLENQQQQNAKSKPSKSVNEKEIGRIETKPQDNPQPTSCKTYINFINKTDVSIKLNIYDGMPDNMNSTRLASFTIAPDKSKKMKAEDETTYYWGAYEDTNGQPTIGGPPKSWQGSIDGEECKTIDEEIE